MIAQEKVHHPERFFKEFHCEGILEELELEAVVVVVVVILPKFLGNWGVALITSHAKVSAVQVLVSASKANNS
jgi:hypothetical protein